jgi:hypothetical protein
MSLLIIHIIIFLLNNKTNKYKCLCIQTQAQSLTDLHNETNVTLVIERTNINL